ncbi:hypothetical protein AA0535_2922 [Asaia krungthepensis NRIC 0535]|uniref:Uncharacterized protein n=1 Tax=Asaia krungthepensis NRIC 0535 TaxID=1307925 RepID=A0ABQ0Q6N9_9PROT|nr:hypothetical protein AA0535_2922 [Asaia krungthepensis NRIC 0535]
MKIPTLGEIAHEQGHARWVAPQMIEDAGRRLSLRRFGLGGEKRNSEGEGGQKAGQHAAKRDETCLLLQAGGREPGTFFNGSGAA